MQSSGLPVNMAYCLPFSSTSAISSLGQVLHAVGTCLALSNTWGAAILLDFQAFSLAKCEACADCVSTCPNELIALVEENGKQYAMFTGNPDDCIGCSPASRPAPSRR